MDFYQATHSCCLCSRGKCQGNTHLQAYSHTRRYTQSNQHTHTPVSLSFCVCSRSGSVYCRHTAISSVTVMSLGDKRSDPSNKFTHLSSFFSLSSYFHFPNCQSDQFWLLPLLWCTSVRGLCVGIRRSLWLGSKVMWCASSSSSWGGAAHSVDPCTGRWVHGVGTDQYCYWPLISDWSTLILSLSLSPVLLQFSVSLDILSISGQS